MRKGTKLYHGSKDPFNVNYDKHTWFSLNEAYAAEYGKNVTEIFTKRDLNLIDVQNPFFQLDFVSQVNKLYPELSQAKVFALAPLGLPSLKAQEALLTHKPGVCNEPDNKTLIWAEYFQGKHRYSFRIGDIKVDDMMVDAMQKIYGEKFQGYIAQYEWPSCYHDGLFHPEVCLFVTKKNVSLTQIKGGGTPTKNKMSKKAMILESNKATQRVINDSGWEGPPKYDKEGYLLFPTMDELDRFRQMRLSDNGHHTGVLAFRKKHKILTPHIDPEYWDSVKYNKHH